MTSRNTAQCTLVRPAEEYPEDVTRLVDVCAKRWIAVSRADAEYAWLQYSNDMCAGWLLLGTDDEIEKALRRFLVEARP